MKYIITSEAIVFFHAGKPVKIEKTNKKYAQILEIFDLPEDNQEEAFAAILAKNENNFTENEFVVTPESVSYKGENLPDVLANKIRAIAKEGLPLNLFVKFWENLNLNPSSSSVRELYDFLAVKELPITEDGCFLAYKGLSLDGYSVHANKNTKVICGKVDTEGRIFNGVGEKIAVQRWDVDDQRGNHCSFGLHVGSLQYAREFSSRKMVVVKVNPKDVVSVPNDCNCQKCRVCAYEVVGEYVEEIKSAVVDSRSSPIPPKPDVSVENRSEFMMRMANYLDKKTNNGDSYVTVRQIQNAFSPDYPSRQRVLDALSELGYFWDEDGEVEL